MLSPVTAIVKVPVVVPAATTQVEFDKPTAGAVFVEE
jgi:hypothetical protein